MVFIDKAPEKQGRITSLHSSLRFSLHSSLCTSLCSSLHSSTWHSAILLKSKVRHENQLAVESVTGAVFERLVERRPNRQANVDMPALDLANQRRRASASSAAAGGSVTLVGLHFAVVLPEEFPAGHSMPVLPANRFDEGRVVEDWHAHASVNNFPVVLLTLLPVSRRLELLVLLGHIPAAQAKSALATEKQQTATDTGAPCLRIHVWPRHASERVLWHRQETQYRVGAACDMCMLSA